MEPLKLSPLAVYALRQILGVKRAEAVIALAQSDQFFALVAAVKALCSGDLSGFLSALPRPIMEKLKAEVLKDVAAKIVR